MMELWWGTNLPNKVRAALLFPVPDRSLPLGRAPSLPVHPTPTPVWRNQQEVAGTYLEGSVEHLLSASAAQQVYDHLLSILLLQKHHMPATEQGSTVTPCHQDTD